MAASHRLLPGRKEEPRLHPSDAQRAKRRSVGHRQVWVPGNRGRLWPLIWLDTDAKYLQIKLLQCNGESLLQIDRAPHLAA